MERTTPPDPSVASTASGRAARRADRTPQVFTPPKNTALRRSAAHRPQVRPARGRGGAQVPALPARGAPNGDVHIQIEDLLPTRDLVVRAAEAEGGGGGLPRRGGGRGDHHRPRVLQRPQRQAARMPGSWPAWKVSRIINEADARACPRPTGSKNSGRPAQSQAVYDLGGGTFDITILEMADSVSSRCGPPAATPTSAARISTRADHRPADRRVPARDGHRPDPGPHGPPAPRGGRGEGQGPADTAQRRRSCCRSIRRTARHPST